MTVVLDQVLWVGDVRLAAISRVSVVPQDWPGGAVFLAAKDPLAILIVQQGVVAAFAPDGSSMAQEVVESLCPGAWDHIAQSA